MVLLIKMSSKLSPTRVWKNSLTALTRAKKAWLPEATSLEYSRLKDKIKTKKHTSIQKMCTKDLRLKEEAFPSLCKLVDKALKIPVKGFTTMKEGSKDMPLTP